ncbi:MAG: MFS transporter [Candidatus Peribacteraceae bacterium]|nr:MFS transporter [Candidatus Peribacteraceae bacterium]
MRSLSRSLNILHVLNDGFYTSFLLFLPFLAADFGMNLTQAGLLGTIVNSLGMLCALPSGYLAMRIGGMRLLILSAILYGIGYATMGLATSYLWLFPIFIAAGIGFALFHPVAFALVTRISPPQERGKNMGNFTAIGDAGKIGISSALTFIVVSMGWRSTALLYGMIAIGLGLFFLWLHRKHEHEAKATTQTTDLRIRTILSRPPFLLAVLTSFFDVFSSASLFVFLPFLLLSRGIDAALLGSFSAVFFLGNLLGKSALGRFSDRFSNASVVIVSELLMALCIILLASSTSVVVIILTSIIAGIFTKGTVPVIQTMIAAASDHHGHFERSFAVSGFINAIALTISPVFLGYISDQWGIVAAFYAMAIIASLAVIPAFLFRLTAVRRLR